MKMHLSLRFYVWSQNWQQDQPKDSPQCFYLRNTASTVSLTAHQALLGSVQQALTTISVPHQLCVSMLSVQTLLSWMQFASRSSTLVQSQQLEPICCFFFNLSTLIINDHLWNLAELCQMTQESVADYTETNRTRGGWWMAQCCM